MLGQRDCLATPARPRQPRPTLGAHGTKLRLRLSSASAPPHTCPLSSQVRIELDPMANGTSVRMTYDFLVIQVRLLTRLTHPFATREPKPRMMP